MKVLFVCTVPTQNNGISNVIFNLLKSFNEADMKFGYVAINNPSPLHIKLLNDSNINLHIIPRKISSPINYIHRLAQVAKHYDVIHVHGNSATMILEMIAAKIAGVKLRIAHSHSISCSYKTIDKIARPLFYTICNGRLACSESAGKWLFRDRDFTIINNGINSSKFIFNKAKRDELKSMFRLQDKIVIGNVANFIPEKNHLFLLDIFAELIKKNDSFRLLLLGDGPLKEEIQQRAHELNIFDKILMPGCVNNPEDYLNVMDLIAMPSFYEGLPLSLLEAQSNGLSAIVSDSISTEVNVTGNLHFYSIKKSSEEWANNIINLLSNEVNRSKDISLECIQTIEESGFDTKTSAKSVVNFYNSKLNKHKS